MVYHKIYIHYVCKFAICVHCGHNHVCNTVAPLSHGRHLFLAKRVCRLLFVYKGRAVMFCHGRRMVSCHWIAEGLVLVGIY